MPAERDELTIADNVLRFLDVVNAEWRGMRRSLAAVPPAPGATQFGTSRRVEVLELPVLPVPPERAAGLPPALRPEALRRDQAELARILPRLRFTPGSLADAPLVECMALLLSPFAPPARGGTLSIVAPDDDEAGRMMVRGFWLQELPERWSVPTEAVTDFREQARQALALLAREPVALGLVRQALASVVLVDHPVRPGGVCTASATHAWVSPRHCPTPQRLADVLLSAAVHGALYVDEALHAKWHTDPQTLDATKVTVPFHGTQRTLEYDTAFHGVHVEYVRWRYGVAGSGAATTGGPAIRASVASLLAHRGHLTDHGAQLLSDLDRLCGEPLRV